MAYKAMPIETVPLDRLRLDLDNYRIPSRPHDELAALNFLFAEEDVLDAGKSILRDGYFDNEVPIVVRTGKDFTVLEGNRRVSALKALNDPDLVPDHAHDVKALLKRYAIEARDLPSSIRVLVAPSRASANPHVARLHTGISKKRWSRDQQANYYYSLLGPGTTVADVKGDYPDVDIVRFVKMAEMRRFLSGVVFVDASLHDYVTGPRLTMSAFEYAYRNATIASALGAEFDVEGFLLPRTRKPESAGASLDEAQRNAVEYLMTEFRAGRLNTRSKAFNKKTDEFEVLLDRLAGISPDPGLDGSQDSDIVGGSSGGGHEEAAAVGVASKTDDAPTDPSPKSTPRGPNHPDTRDALQLQGLGYEALPENLQLRYHELRRLSLSKTPIATAMMLRSVLETTIKFHFEGTTTPAPGTLNECFALVVAAYGTKKSLKLAIDTVQSGVAGKPGSRQWFNVLSHSADAVVDPRDVREAFRLVNPILRRLIQPPS